MTISKKYIINTSIFVVICIIVFAYNKKYFFRNEPMIVVSSGTYCQGDTFTGVMESEGINPYDRSCAQNALNREFKVNTIKVGDKYEIFKSTFGTLYEFKYWLNRVEYFNVYKSTDNKFYCDRIKIDFEEVTTTASGQIKSTLYEAMVGKNVSPELVMTFADIFSWQIDFLTDPRQQDTFKVVYKQHKYKNGWIDDRNIIAASYTGKLTGKNTAVYFESQDKKIISFYTPEGNSLRKMFLKAPLSYRRISSFFSKSRFHPILKYYRPHHGIDYSAPTGTPVSSIGDGTVVFVGWKGGTGKTIIIKHNATYTTLYGHLSRYVKGVRIGKRVRQGDLIGYVGATGLATGPHLHFGLTKDGKYVNFFSLKFPAADSVPGKYKTEFEAVKNNALSQLNIEENNPK